MGSLNNKPVDQGQQNAQVLYTGSDPVGGGAVAGYQTAKANPDKAEENFWKVNDPLNVSGHNASIGPTGGAPQKAGLQQGTSVTDVRNAQQGVGNSLQAQQQLLAALQSQNGMGVQNSAVQGLQGAASMYGDIAAGRGPNVAQSMLNQQTGANVANQAALMAGQRGASANTGLIARQAGQQGAATQQQAVGQGATMQAQQQQSALSGLVGAQNAVGGLGTQMAGQQIGQVNANAQAALGNQGQMQSSLGGYNNALVSNQASVNAGNTALAQQAQAARAGMLGGLMNAGGAALGAEGGQVQQQPQPVIQPPVVQNAAAPGMSSMQTGPASMFGQAAQAPEQPVIETEEEKKSGKKGGLDLGKIASVAMMLADGGLAEGGGHVEAAPGQEAVSGGNDYANDKIPAKLSEGEIVLPRSVTMSQDPVKAAADFVSKTLAEKKSGGVNMADGGLMPEPQSAPIDQAPLNPAMAAEPSPTMAPTAAPQPPMAQAAPAPQIDPETAQTLDEQIKINQDMASGKITPMTYSSMFAKKDTLGKIGSIFGLLLSGAGSGLAKQPNMLLHMMDKQIDQDLEAQKANKDNARSFLTTISENKKRRAEQSETEMDVLNKGVAGAEKAKITGNVMGQVGGSQFFNKYSSDQQRILDGLEAKPIMRDAAVDHLEKSTAGNPNAQATLNNVIKPAVAKQNADDLARRDAAKKLFDAKNIDNPVDDSLVVNQKVLDKALQKAAIFGENAAKVGAMTKEDADALPEEIEKERIRRQEKKAFLKMSESLGQLEHGGQSRVGILGKLIPGAAKEGAASAADTVQQAFENERTAFIGPLKRKYGEEFIESITPGLADNAKTRAEKIKLGLDFFERERKTPLLNKYKKRIPGLIIEEKEYNPSGLSKSDIEKFKSEGGGAPGEKAEKYSGDKASDGFLNELLKKQSNGKTRSKDWMKKK